MFIACAAPGSGVLQARRTDGEHTGTAKWGL